MRKAEFKKTVAAMLAALMVVQAMDYILPGNTVRAIQHTQEMTIQDEEKQKLEERVTEMTSSAPKELEGDMIEPEVNAYSQGEGHFTVTLNGSGNTVSYRIYLYNVKNEEPAVGDTVSITKIGSKDIPSANEPQWKVVRLDNNGSAAKDYFDLSFEELILRRDGPTSHSQGWSGIQLKVKFNMDKHVFQISQTAENIENGRLCLIVSSDPEIQQQMIEENNLEAKDSCTDIMNKLKVHDGATGITGYLQCNSYNCGLADYNEDGNYSFGELTINFKKGKESLKINPNHGIYTGKNGETITGTSAKELTTKTCGETTAINTPKRTGYTFDGWIVTNGTGGNGSYNSSTKKYTHCTKEGTGATTLKATWKKVGATNTPAPTLAPEFNQTVEYYTWSETEQKWQQLGGKEVYSVKKGDMFDCRSLAEKNQPGGYYISDIIVQSAETTKWNSIERSYVVNTATIVHINYRPNCSTLQVDPNGGTWNGNNKVQGFTQAYGTSLQIPKPIRDKYKFDGWNQRISNGSMSDDNTTYKFGPNAEVTDYITAKWKAIEFEIRYERNEPSGIEKLPMQPQNELNIGSQDSIHKVGSYANARFLGWCLAIGAWDKKTGELTSVRWLKADGTFDGVEIQKGEKRFDTEGYTGKIFPNLASVQELVPYVNNDGEVLTLVGMWSIDVDYDAEDGINTAALSAGQHGIAPDKTFALINEAPSLLGNEFVEWIDPVQQAINKVGKSYAETGKTMYMQAMESSIKINVSDSKTYDKGQTINKGFENDKILYATYQYYIQYQKADGTIIEKDNVAKKKEFARDYGTATTISDVTYPTNGNTQGHHYTSEKLWHVTANSGERYKYADASNYPGKNYSNSYKQGATALVNRSVILKAVEEANTYIIKYNANNDAASTKKLQNWSKMRDQKITYGENITIKDIAGSELPGYTFAGWNTKADGSGVNFSNKEGNTVKEFLSKARKSVDEDGAVIHLYAQWRAKSYTITFDVNRPSPENNTHTSSNAPVLSGTDTLEYVWDSVIVDNKIEDLYIPQATLKGWHQRFSDSLWYTMVKYNAPGVPVKSGTKLGYEILGLPGNKTVYAQWKANTYTVEFDGNGIMSGGRGNVQGVMEPQILIYDKEERLKKNTYKKQDETYQYHDEEKIKENLHNTKYNKHAVDSFKYYWIGWSRKHIMEGEETEEDRNKMILYADAERETMWNLTEEEKGTVVLYAFWDAVPNITTRTENAHFDRYQGAYLKAADMKEIVKAYDLEEGEELKVAVKNISYYLNGDLVKSVDFPRDNYVLDTSLPETLWKDGKYKSYSITFETVDSHQVKNYMQEQPKKEAVYFGKIYYNNTPVIEPYNKNGIFQERYLYLQEMSKLGEEELKAVLVRHVIMEDKEDSSYEQDQKDDLYLGRCLEKPKIEIVQLQEIFQTVLKPEENWDLQEKEKGKKLNYTIRYTDIFGKEKTKDNELHIIDSEHDSFGELENPKKVVRFISKEYFDTLERDSQWYQKEENKKQLEDILNKKEKFGEDYEIQKIK